MIMLDDDSPDELLAAQADERSARREVADASAALATIATARRAKLAHIARLQADLAAIEAQAAAQQAVLDQREREHAETEETLLRAHCVALAAKVITWHAQDPLRNRFRVRDGVAQLRRSVRSGLDTPVNQRQDVDPLVTSALSLAPPLDPMHQPVHELGSGAGAVPWPQRRKLLLAAFEDVTPPLQAA